LLQEVGKMSCKTISPLVHPNAKLGNEKNGVPVGKEMYQSLVRRLFIYFTLDLLLFLL